MTLFYTPLRSYHQLRKHILSLEPFLSLVTCDQDHEMMKAVNDALIDRMEEWQKWWDAFRVDGVSFKSHITI